MNLFFPFPDVFFLLSPTPLPPPFARPGFSSRLIPLLPLPAASRLLTRVPRVCCTSSTSFLRCNGFPSLTSISPVLTPCGRPVSRKPPPARIWFEAMAMARIGGIEDWLADSGFYGTELTSSVRCFQRTVNFTENFHGFLINFVTSNGSSGMLRFCSGSKVRQSDARGTRCGVLIIFF